MGWCKTDAENVTESIYTLNSVGGGVPHSAQVTT